MEIINIMSLLAAVVIAIAWAGACWADRVEVRMNVAAAAVR